MIDFKLNEIKRELEKMRCTVCNEHPKVEVKNKTISFKPCCEPFGVKVKANLERLITLKAGDSIKKQVNDMFNGFKKM